MEGYSRVAGPTRRALIVLALAMVIALAWSGFRAWGSWRSVERLAFDTESARTNLDATRATATTLPMAGPEPDPVELPPPPSPFDEVFAVLIVGSDHRSEADLSRRADVILMFVIAPGDAPPLLFSLPRDLYVPNPCTGGTTRINENLNGCGDDVSGPEQLAIAVEDFTGIGVDHFAVFGFDGFERVIDRVGGIEICVEHQVRDLNSGLDLAAGCTRADGEQALAWVRSRRTQEMVDGRWQGIEGMDDLVRNQRQQEMLLEALRRLKGFRSISELSALVDDLADAFVVDEGLSLSGAVNLAWDVRSVEMDNIVRLVIPTSRRITPGGEDILDPVESFWDTLYEADPDLAVILLGEPQVASSE